MEENTRLTDLTRMLLSSQAFSGFLSELSGTAPPSSTSSLQQPQTSSQPQTIPKDVNPHQVARQLQNQQQQIGMATIPEQSVDFSLAETNPPASSWNSTVGLVNFPVFSLIKLPEGPALDVETLSGKVHGGSLLQAYESENRDATKQDMPNIEYARLLVKTEEFSSVSSLVHTGSDSKLDTTAFTLYSEPSSTFQEQPFAPEWSTAWAKDAKPANTHIDIVPCADENALAARLASMCSQLDAVSARIAAVTSHLA